MASVRRFLRVGDHGNYDTGEPPVIQFWSADGTHQKTIPIPGGAAIRGLDWGPDGTRLATTSEALRIWSAAGKLKHLGESPDRLWGVRWHPDGNRIVTSSEEGRVTLWSAEAQMQRVVE